MADDESEATEPAAVGAGKFKQAVLHDCGYVGKYRARLVMVDRKGGVVLDIREYIVGANYEGFTRKGVRITRESFHDLEKLVEKVKAELGW